MNMVVCHTCSKTVSYPSKEYMKFITGMCTVHCTLTLAVLGVKVWYNVKQSYLVHLEIKSSINLKTNRFVSTTASTTLISKVTRFAIGCYCYNVYLICNNRPFSRVASSCSSGIVSTLVLRCTVTASCNDLFVLYLFSNDTLIWKLKIHYLQLSKILHATIICAWSLFSTLARVIYIATVDLNQCYTEREISCFSVSTMTTVNWYLKCS